MMEEEIVEASIEAAAYEVLADKDPGLGEEIGFHRGIAEGTRRLGREMGVGLPSRKEVEKKVAALFRNLFEQGSFEHMLLYGSKARAREALAAHIYGKSYARIYREAH